MTRNGKMINIFNDDILLVNGSWYTDVISSACWYVDHCIWNYWKYSTLCGTFNVFYSEMKFINQWEEAETLSGWLWPPRSLTVTVCDLWLCGSMLCQMAIYMTMKWLKSLIEKIDALNIVMCSEGDDYYCKHDGRRYLTIHSKYSTIINIKIWLGDERADVHWVLFSGGLCHWAWPAILWCGMEVIILVFGSRAVRYSWPVVARADEMWYSVLKHVTSSESEPFLCLGFIDCDSGNDRGCVSCLS